MMHDLTAPIRHVFLAAFLVLFGSTCHQPPAMWQGSELSPPRDGLTVEQLHTSEVLPLMDMSFFARPAWAKKGRYRFSGAITFKETEMLFPLPRPYYPGEQLFPGITLEFISDDRELIPVRTEIQIDHMPSQSLWSLLVGTGKIWQEEEDADWSRASFPLSLTDSYIGRVHNCVATFVYRTDLISNVYMQCSQETADLNDGQVGDIRAMLPVRYQPRSYTDSLSILARRARQKSERFAVLPLARIDPEGIFASYLERPRHTRAPTSLGAIVRNDTVYLHPPRTRHGVYPYPQEMHHAVYSVTKSMAGALALFYFARRYGEEIFDALITDYVPPLASHPGWQGVTFGHTLNMITGTEGGEDASHLYEVLVKARSAEEAIHNIALLGDAPEAPGEAFHYASTNFFVLSYALQHYVAEKEGETIPYWHLVREHVLIPLGIGDFNILHTVEPDGSEGLPILAYGARPTLDHAAKIAALFAQEGRYRGQQLLHRETYREALGRTTWKGYSTGNDDRGAYYRHSFWATPIKTKGCELEVTYMLGYGGNYVGILPDDTIFIRFMDEYDLNLKALVKRTISILPICH